MYRMYFYQEEEYKNDDFIQTIYRNGIHKNMTFWRTLNYKSKGLKAIEHRGFPYYFSICPPSSLTWYHPQTWNQVDWIVHDPKGLNTTFMNAWDKILYMPLTHNSWPGMEPWEGKQLDGGSVMWENK